MKYTVVVAHELDTLIAEVNKLATSGGWQPLGGICLSETVQSDRDIGGGMKHSFDTTYLQAMVQV